MLKILFIYFLILYLQLRVLLAVQVTYDPGCHPLSIYNKYYNINYILKLLIIIQLQNVKSISILLNVCELFERNIFYSNIKIVGVFSLSLSYSFLCSILLKTTDFIAVGYFSHRRVMMLKFSTSFFIFYVCSILYCLLKGLTYSCQVLIVPKSVLAVEPKNLLGGCAGH